MIAATAMRHEDLWRSFGVCQLLPQAHDFMTVLVLQLFEPVTITLSLRQLPLEVVHLLGHGLLEQRL